MNEEQTRYDYIDPKLKASLWGEDGSRVVTEHPITDGKIELSGRRKNPKKADYVLEYKNKKLAVIEAKRLELSETEGLEQAKMYGKMLGLDFVYSTNGSKIYEFSLKTGKGSLIESFPTPEELWNKNFSDHSYWKEKFAKTPFKLNDRKPRYYQENAVNKALEAVSEDKKRVLLTLATGTGKTYIASQISYKLYETKWNLQGSENRRPRVLFLADRNILATQALNDFNIFTEDSKIRISPSELRKSGYEVPTNGSIFFSIFQTLVGEKGDETFYEKYPSDFFDCVIIDECHRGGANDESSWRKILDHFSPAIQIGLTATPKRKNNIDTYDYFGSPVYQYSLKEGIDDGFLTPFKVKIIDTNIDSFTFSPDDEVLEGEVEEGKKYEEKDFNVSIEIVEREKHRVKVMMENINPDEKTIVFCASQKHALLVRDIINEIKTNPNSDYCVRVTANDGVVGETFLKQFQDNEKTIPTILTTSQKLSTGVDARNIRNIVLMRPVNSMIEFKQIIGRGTRIFEGKRYFTILDFVEAHEKFSDPDWDGEPIDQTREDIVKGKEEEEESEEKVYKEDDVLKENGSRKKIVIKLSDGKVRELQSMVSTSFYDSDGNVISSQDFLENLFGILKKDFFKNEQDLRKIWSVPATRKNLLSDLDKKGYSLEQLEDFGKIINAEKSDVYDVLQYISFAIKPISRKDRVEKNRTVIFEGVDKQMAEFLNFTLRGYEEDGFEALGQDKISDVLDIHFGGIHESEKLFGDTRLILSQFLKMQEKLYY